MSSDRLAFWGWLLFAVSGVFFLVEGVRAADAMMLGSAVSWLAGVGLFIVAGRADD